MVQQGATEAVDKAQSEAGKAIADFFQAALQAGAQVKQVVQLSGQVAEEAGPDLVEAGEPRRIQAYRCKACHLGLCSLMAYIWCLFCV